MVHLFSGHYLLYHSIHFWNILACLFYLPLFSIFAPIHCTLCYVDGINITYAHKHTHTHVHVCFCAFLLVFGQCLRSTNIIQTCSAPAVPAKEPYDADSNEFNSAYSIKVTANSDSNETDHTAMDTFEHILQMTSHHEAVYAYYYMDDNNKVSAANFIFSH